MTALSPERTRLRVDYLESPSLAVEVKLLERQAPAGAPPKPGCQMNALVICPAERPGVAALAEREPLVNVPILGKALIEYWLEHLAKLGAKQILVLATDRPEQVSARIGDGARWGLRVTVISEPRELSPAEARAKYCTPELVGDDMGSLTPSENNKAESPCLLSNNIPNPPRWLPEPSDTILLDHLPGLPQQTLFDSFASWFAALRNWMLHLPTTDRIGLHEAQPGVWLGLRTRVSPLARLHPPCWLGDSVYVGPKATIGPCAILEDRAFVEEGSEISYTAIAPDTFVGKLTALKQSLAWGRTLIDWRDGSRVDVPDPFLLCSLRQPRPAAPEAHALRRLAGRWAMLRRLLMAWFLIARGRLRDFFSPPSSGHWLKERA